jgi:hypothetical protein
VGLSVGRAHDPPWRSWAASSQTDREGELTSSHDPSGPALPEGPGWRITRRALYLDAELAFDEWVRVGGKVAVVSDSSAWWVGDWLNFGRASYRGRYKTALALTSLDYQTLRNYAWVASRFAPSRRRDTISFGHYAELAALSDEDQDGWLAQCAAEQWSRAELRRRLRAEGQMAEDSSHASSIALSVHPDRLRRWEAAADVDGAQLEEWIGSVLDRAAADALGDGADVMGAELRTQPALVVVS